MYNLLEASFYVSSLANHIMKIHIYNWRGPLLALAVMSFTLGSWAQNSTITLLDHESALPIVEATFTYGDQNGVSNKQGRITFDHKEGQTMVFSHINYGKWSLTPTELLAAVAEGVLYRQTKAISLYPVTVIALRPNEKPTEQVKLEYQDQLAHDAATVLQQNPAMNSIRKGGNYGFDPVFRGFKYDQLNIVLNGAQSATAACPNRMDPPTSQMAPNMLDRIEVLKGPHALRYGTGFGATINFIPSKLRFTEENDVYGRISNGYEGNGSLFRSEGKVGFSGEGHDIAIFGSWSQGNDYATGNDQLVPADFSRGSFGTQMGFRIGEAQQLRASVIYNVARDADFPALAMDLRDDDTFLFNVRHDITFEKKNLNAWNTTVFASFVDHLMDNLLKPLDPRMLNAQNRAQTYNYGGRTEGIWNFENTQLYAGADFRKEGAEGIREREFLMGPNAGRTFEDNAWQEGFISRTGLFAEYHLNAQTMNYVLATRWELNNANANDATDSFLLTNGDPEVTQFNFSASLGATKQWGDSMSLGLFLGRASRSAGLTERFINFFAVGQDPFELVGDPGLKAEINNQVDLTWVWRKKNTTVNIDLFGSYMENFISSFIDPNLTPVLPMSPGVRRFTNIRNAFKTGFEINWSQQLLLGLQQRVAVAYTYAQDLERDQPLPEIAPLDFRYSLIGSYFKGKWQPELMFRHVVKQTRISPEFGETNTPAFSLLDVTMGYQLNPAARLNLGINNIFDTNYYEHLNRSVVASTNPIFAPGRNIFASINYVF